MLIAGVLALEQATRLFHSNVVSRDGESHSVYIYPHMDIDSLLRVLDKDFIIQSPLNFRFHATLMRMESPREGHYVFSPQEGDVSAIRKLRGGLQTPVTISFRNIRTRSQLAGRLSSQLLLDSIELISRLEDDEYLSRYGLKKETAVTLFLPDKYEVYWTISPDQLFDKMAEGYHRFWTAERLDQAREIGLEPWQVATLASIVEEETNKDVDKPIIAGLYLNRLRLGMPLQACPTIRYAWQDFTIHRVVKHHLEIESPYNTYKYNGLPPGPIRVVQAKTMDYVLHYTPSKYLYMCASKALDGTHHFSATYSEHARYAREYQHELNRRNIH